MHDVSGSTLKKRIYGNEYKYVQEVLDTQFCTSQSSRMMTRLEQAFADRFGISYAISHINGTATMHSVLEAIGVGPGDEVIVPPLTMASTSFVVLQTGATPVFADVESDTFQINPESVLERITGHTKAIITVALFGLSPDMDKIMEIAEKYSLLVIEDNAECFLGEYKGRLAGTLGHAASFSFQSSKHLTAGEGGMTITNDPELALRIRRIVSLGYAGVGAGKGKISRSEIQEPNYSRHIQLGWNYRMPELCAAVALAQVENIDALVQRRIDVANLFSDVIEDISWLVPQFVGPGYKHVYWTWVIKIDDPEISWYDFRNKFIELGGDGIYGTWKLTYQEPMFQEKNFLGREKFISQENLDSYQAGLCPVAEDLQTKLLQFKTNYWDFSAALKQAEILKQTIDFFTNWRRGLEK
ncbi:MAG: DegT/DnrJ/EryC1/StrS family aminotransferase [Spirochaetes bacterium]|nr:DegT/DnrJ/EryC1/StrS family aminotransferase [Spirochaetota bacterium]